jgi:hypothetical protein
MEDEWQAMLEARFKSFDTPSFASNSNQDSNQDRPPIENGVDFESEPVSLYLIFDL